MKLSTLTSATAPIRVTPGAGNDVEITGVFYRSGDVLPGGLFVALKGTRADGHDYVGDAVCRGAAAVMTERPVAAAVPVIEVSDTRKAMAAAACAFYGDPSARMTLIGITGTNGKTTTAFLVEHLLKQHGAKTGVIGTINYRIGDRVDQYGLTTPEAPDLQLLLSRMANDGVTHVVMEVSSHGVVLDRISGCRFKVGVFTNLSQDHLDFHGNMDAYWEAKRRFFTCYLNGPAEEARGACVINRNDHRGRALSAELNGARQVTVGTGPADAVRATDVRLDGNGIDGRLIVPDSDFPFRSRLVGRFNLENILCAAGAAVALGIPPECIRGGIETFSTVPGRLEPVPNGSGRHVFVDFSHTPDALENVLTTLRTIIPGRLICIFGCGGDRDRTKRPLMGEIAAAYADLAIVTSDNPRTEPPEGIIADILAGVRRTPSREVDPARIAEGFDPGNFTVVPDRAAAIRIGIRASRPGDAVLIAGKGHETCQIIGRQTIPFDDRVEAERALAENGLLRNDRNAMDN